MKIETFNPAKTRDYKPDDIVRMICDAIRQTNLSDEQVKTIHIAAEQRLRAVTCFVCGKLKPQMLGTYQFIDGDLSKPKRFVCKQCGEK